MKRLTKSRKEYGFNGYMPLEDSSYLEIYTMKQYLCFDKLGQLEDIEEELGIELITLWKAVKQEHIYINIAENNKWVDKIVEVGVGGIVYDEECKVWRLTNIDRYDGAFWGSLATTKNNGTIWALTREELENV